MSSEEDRLKRQQKLQRDYDERYERAAFGNKAQVEKAKQARKKAKQARREAA